MLSWLVSNVLLALVLALAAWSVQRWFRRPALAHVLWVLVLVKLVTPPLVSVPVGEALPRTACELGTCQCPHDAHPRTAGADALPWVLLGLWVVGATVTARIAWRRWSRFGHLVALADPAPAEWQALAETLSAELSIRCAPEVLVVPGALPPMVIPGRHRARVLLPADLLDRRDPAQRAALLLHELVHIKRGDHLVRILELAVGVAFWWFPVVGRIGHAMRACEEACCDAAVVAHLPEARRAYAELLLDVVDFVTPVPVRVTAMSAASGLERRLRAILHGPGGTRCAWPVWVLALLFAFAILPCELRYDLAGRPAPAAPEPERAPAAGDTPAPDDERDNKLSKSVCCPSKTEDSRR
jgi:beta-lactamase regulating signal transducer with metallopeptidase domain